MLPSRLSIHLSERRWSCVLDPALALSSALGPLLVQRLGEVVDLWMPPALFRVLDSSEFYRRDTRSLARLTGGEPGEAEQALRTWERIRARSDLSGMRFFWLADNFGESSVPAGTPPDLVQRYERMSAALAPRLDFDDEDQYPLRALTVDVAALTAALGPTLLLTRARSDAQPGLVAVLQACGLPCKRLDADTISSLAREERDLVRDLVLQAGLAPVTWAGLELAVAHLLVPGAAELRTAVDAALSAGEGDGLTLAGIDEEAAPRAGLWSGARVFWYPL